MRCRARRWAHSMDPRHEVEQAGYDLIGAMIKRWRLRAGLTQRQLERLSGIDQTVISRLENGRQYGLRWSRFAILIAVLGGIDDGRSEPSPPWWVTMGVRIPEYRLETLRQLGLIPLETTPSGEPDDRSRRRSHWRSRWRSHRPSRPRFDALEWHQDQGGSFDDGGPNTGSRRPSRLPPRRRGPTRRWWSRPR